MSENAKTPEKKASTAKDTGIRWLKIYGVFYLILVVLYGIHLYAGSEDVQINNIKSDRKIWANLIFTYKGEHIELEAGTVLSDTMLMQYRTFLSTLSEGEERPTKLRLHKRNAFRNFPVVFGVWNFVGLVLLLYTALGDLVPKMLDSYCEKLKSDLGTAREAKAESERLKERHAEMLERVEKEREVLKGRASEESDHYYKHIIHQTHEDVARMREALGRHLDAQANIAANALRGRVAGDAVDAARERLGEISGSDLHHNKVAEFIKQLKGVRL